MGRPPMVPNPGLSANASKPTFKRFNENEHSSNNEPGSSIRRKQSNRLLGNRQAFLNQTDQAVNQNGDSLKMRRETGMSNSTKAFSESVVNANGLPPGQDVENPHADLELTEEELDEIMSRPHMNPNHARYGCDP